jgi:hypothetical protein
MKKFSACRIPQRLSNHRAERGQEDRVHLWRVEASGGQHQGPREEAGRPQGEPNKHADADAEAGASLRCQTYVLLQLSGNDVDLEIQLILMFPWWRFL